MEENTISEAVEVAEPIADTSPKTSDDIWNADPFEGRVDAEEAPAAPVPSEEVVEDKEEKTEDEVSAEDESTDESKEEPEDTQEPQQRRYTRTKLRKIADELLAPLDDPETPISDVLSAIQRYNPLRSEELFQTVINESVKLHPNEWLKAVLGMDVTVSDVQAKFSEVEPTKSERPDLKSATERLDDLYDGKWRDPANDANLYEDDLLMAQILRNIDTTNSEKDKELTKLQEKLDELAPKVAEFQTAQEQERERFKTEVFERSITEFRESVEGAVLPKLYEEMGFKESPDDTDGIKAVKTALRSQFESKYGMESEFDRYVVNEFAQAEQFAKVARRVGKYFAEAAEARAEARRAGGDKAKELGIRAESLEAQAKDERDTLAVMSKKAAQDFLKSSSMGAVMSVLEENADLQRRLGQITGRKEVVGHSAAAVGTPWKDKLKEDPWSSDVLSDRLSALTR